ncbi:MAG TPA: SHOCT domain-containing protein [Streptosporangiaceae bacterium]|nr:SHOCT domain-containing protein [Streptosporangiaceae bacterium]
MFRRRPLLRAAAVGGGAYMMGKSRARSQAEQSQMEADQNQRIGDLEQQQAYQPPPAQQAPPPPAAPAPAAPAPSSAMLDQLNQLATLHQQGVLTDDEFTAAKAKLFGT